MTWVWPYKTFGEMTAAGYIFRNASKCAGKDCNREVYWFRSPKGYFMAVDVDSLKPHWSSCPNAQDFKKKEKSNAEQSEEKSKGSGSGGLLRKPISQGTLFDK